VVFTTIPQELGWLSGPTAPWAAWRQVRRRRGRNLVTLVIYPQVYPPGAFGQSWPIFSCGVALVQRGRCEANGLKG